MPRKRRSTRRTRKSVSIPKNAPAWLKAELRIINRKKRTRGMGRMGLTWYKAKPIVPTDKLGVMPAGWGRRQTSKIMGTRGISGPTQRRAEFFKKIYKV